MAADRVMLGVIVGAQGVRGAVRVKSFTGTPEDVGAYGPVEDEAGARRFELRVVGASRGAVIAKLKGIDDRNAAETLKGTRLYVARAALPAPDEDEFYHADLVGLAAVLVDGSPFGRIRAVHEFGAGDSLEIERPEGGTILVPFTKAAVPQVDVKSGRLVIDPPEGLFENPPQAAEKTDDDPPPPLRGRVGEGGESPALERQFPPTPTLPRKGGGRVA